MVVQTFTALALVVIADLVAVSCAMLASNKNNIRVRWGDLTYILLLKWFATYVFFELATGGTYSLTVSAVVLLSLFNLFRLLGTINAVGASRFIINIRQIHLYERLAVLLNVLSALMMGASCLMLWHQGPERPIVISLAFFGLFIMAFRYTADVGFRTWINLVSFQLMFDNREIR